MTTPNHNTATSAVQSGTEQPIEGFRHCHTGIIDQFERLRALATQLPDVDQAVAVKAAAEFVNFFSAAVLTHHEEEERDLFPAVKQHAASGDEAQLVATLIKRLASEHRELEASWKRLAPEIRRLAKGKPASIDAQGIKEFADAYIAHARFEEAAFLPLSAKVLGPQGQASLGLQIHARHVLDRVVAYI